MSARPPGRVVTGGAVERAHRGLGEHIRSFNVQPGFILTERMIQDMGSFGFDTASGAPPAVVGKVCAWLLASPDADRYNGLNVEAQELCDELNLLPGWSLETG